MSDKRKHRGPHPSDHKIFSHENIYKLNCAIKDLNYLLGKEYSLNSATEIVGNRYQLVKRQRKALALNVCPVKIKYQRLARHKNLSQCQGDILYIDGFNYLITLESILSHAYVFMGADKCLRDLSGVHGSYKLITETEEALILTGKLLKVYNIAQAVWILDKPVSNSGRLKQFMENIASENTWNWQVELEYNPDTVLVEHGSNLVSHDSYVLDHCQSWINIPLELVNYFGIKPNTILME